MSLDGNHSAVKLNQLWEQRIKESGADFVSFVDISSLSHEMTEGYPCAVLFGKALSREYISDLRAEREPKHKEVLNSERKMDTLAVKIAEQLAAEGYRSIGKLKTGQLPHKTVALRAGLGFIGKNNLLVTPQYGCALMMGKVLTEAPFTAHCVEPHEPQCGSCQLCVEVCPNKALLGKTWTVTTSRDEILTRKLCTLCVKCMACCPYTAKYIEQK